VKLIKNLKNGHAFETSAPILRVPANLLLQFLFGTHGICIAPSIKIVISLRFCMHSCME
jgi:hypothetical protein